MGAHSQLKIENAKLTDQGWYKCQFSDLISTFDVFATKVFLEVLNPCITTTASTITTSNTVTKTTVTTTTEITTKITTFIDQNGLINKNSTRPCKKIATIDVCENSIQEEHECIECIKKCLHRHKVRGPKKPAQKFDGWSFIGGILYTIIIMAIGLVVYKSAIAKRSRTSNLNYSLTTSPEVK